jgi:hypothetical protein
MGTVRLGDFDVVPAISSCKIFYETSIFFDVVFLLGIVRFQGRFHPSLRFFNSIDALNQQ